MTSSAAVLLSTHLLATAAMVGLIWFVQVVHYPLFASVGSEGFARYEQVHQRRTSYIVGPLMATEGGTAVWLALATPNGISRLWPLLGLVALGVIHASTVFLQVPQHSALSGGFDPARVQRLVRTNWIRTLGWSVRGIIAAAMVVEALSS